MDGPGHCGACHTPKTFLGGDKASQYLRGGFLQGWSAPDITGDTRVGVGAWSAEDLVAYLKSGHNRVSAATGPMAEVVTLSTEHMTDPDLEAIASYLKSLSGKPDHPQALSKEDPAMVVWNRHLPRSVFGVSRHRRKGGRGTIPVDCGLPDGEIRRRYDFDTHRTARCP